MDRYQRKIARPIQFVLRDASDNPIDADNATSVTYSLAYSDATVVATGTASHSGSAGSGLYQFTLSAANSSVLDVYTATWTATIGGSVNTYTSSFEIVGAFLFGLNELRAADAALASTQNYPDSTLIDAREYAEEVIENYCRRTFRLKGTRAILDGDGTRWLGLDDLFPTSLVSASIDSGAGTFTALTSSELAEVRYEDYGALVRPLGKIWDAGYQNVKVLYEYGPSAVPQPIRRAALLLAKSRVLQGAKAGPDNATSLSTEVGTFRLTQPGRDGATGIPEVDAILDQFGSNSPIAI